MNRGIKRIIIIFIYLAILLLIALFIYWIAKADPTCFDGKRNQNETSVDCGGGCTPCPEVIKTQPLSVSEKDFVYGGQGKYDVMAKISNPNNQYGSSFFSYEFTLTDSSGNTISERKGKGFILPAETKYIIENNLETNVAPGKVEVRIIDTNWDSFSGYEKPKLNIYNKRYDLISSGVGYSEVYGLLRNESPFDFNLIKINVILRDSAGRPVALNSTDMRTVNANEQRDFRLYWPTSFPGEVQNVEMEAEADVYSTDNFTKKYIPGGKFQNLQ